MVTIHSHAPPTAAPPARGGGPRTAVLLLTSTLTVMSGAIISPALTGLAREFSGAPGSATLVPLLLSAPALSIAIFAPIAGRLVDRVGRRPVLMVSLVLYAVAGGSGLVLGDLFAVLAGRFVLGVAVAGIMVTATTLVSDYFSGEHRSKVLGYQAASMNLGGVVFLALGGVLASWSSRGPFAVYLLALVLLPAVWRLVDEPGRSGAEEAGASAGARPGRLLDSWRLLVVVYVLATVGMLVFYTIPTRLPFFLQDLGGYGPTAVGLVMALPNLVGAVVSTAYGWVHARFGFGSLAVATVALLGAGVLVIAPAGGLGQVLGGLVLVGAGSGLLLPTVNGWVSTGTPAVVRATALGGLSTAIYLGQFASPLLSAPLVDGSGGSGVYHGAAALALVAAVGLVVVLSSRRRREVLQAPAETTGRP